MNQISEHMEKKYTTAPRQSFKCTQIFHATHYCSQNVPESSLSMEENQLFL